MRVVPVGVVLFVLGLIALAVLVMQQSPAPERDLAIAPASRDLPQGHVYTCASEEPVDVNPLTARGPAARSLVLGMTHDTLLDRDAVSGALRPALAGAHELHADGLGCTFTLRDDVRFADGSPVTTDDVMLPWQLHRAGHLRLGYVGDAMRLLASVEVLDDRRVRVRFAERHFAAAATVGENWIVASRRFFVDAVRARLPEGEAMPDIDTERFAQLLDRIDLQTGPGTGPYELRDDVDGAPPWRPQQDLLLVRNESSWRRAARPGSWNFAAIRILFRDQAGARNALLAGELDVYSGSDADRLLAAHPDIQQRYRRAVYDYAQLGVYRIVWNCARAPFDDARVRRALGMLVDRAAVVDMIAPAVAAAAHAKPHDPVCRALEPLAFDVAAARRALADLGHGGAAGEPLQLSLLALDGTDALRGIVALLRDAARAADVDLQVRQLAMGPFVGEMRQGDWDGLLVLQTFPASGDPFRFLHRDGAANYGGWQHDDADRLAVEARATLDDERRQQLWSRLHVLAADEQPACLIAHPKAVVLIHRALSDFEPGVYGLRPEWAWVAEELQRDR